MGHAVRKQKSGGGETVQSEVGVPTSSIVGHAGKRWENERLTSSVSPGTWMMPSYRGGDPDVKMELTK